MLPPWDVFHVLLIHFPVACFVFAPLVLILALLKPAWRQSLLILTLDLLVVGTVFTYLTVWSGEAAAELLKPSPEVKAVLDEHQEGGENLRNLYTAITLLLAAAMYGPALLKKTLGPRLELSARLMVLALCLGGALMLTDVAHEGGRLVHVFGVHARLEPGAPPSESEHH